MVYSPIYSSQMLGHLHTGKHFLVMVNLCSITLIIFIPYVCIPNSPNSL